MTYFGFLAIFLGIPLIAIFYLTWRDQRLGRRLPPVLDTWPAWMPVLLHVLIAVLYTTPWDNYLVATGVWYYDPARVTGVTLGWVPIEEYTFFVLQSLLAGFTLLFVARRMSLSAAPVPPRVALRVIVNSLLALLVLAGILILASGWQPGTYLALILVWALPPIMIQVGWGAHILWHYGKLVFPVLAGLTLYLSLTDLLAIGSGIWTIDPAQSTQVFIFNILPVEEFIFFLVTNTLLVFGVTLALAKPSLEQFTRLKQALSQHARRDPVKEISVSEMNEG